MELDKAHRARILSLFDKIHEVLLGQGLLPAQAVLITDELESTLETRLGAVPTHRKAHEYLDAIRGEGKQ